MKNIFYIIALTLCIYSCSEPPAPVKLDDKTTLYGDSISVNSPMTLAQLNTKMVNKEELANVLIEGEIVGTCAHKGCWMTINNEGAEPMRVRFKDYDFFVPTEGAEGKQTIFKGRAFKEEVSVDHQHHYIDDMNVSELEKEKLKAGVTEAKDVLAFEAVGVIIKD